MNSSLNPPSTRLSSAMPLTRLLVTLPSFPPAAEVVLSFAADTLLFLAARFSFPATTTPGEAGGGRLKRSLVVWELSGGGGGGEECDEAGEES